MGLVIDEVPSTDRSQLDWWATGLAAGNDVRSWIPDVFERYARILHPAYRREESPQGITHVLVTWRELANWSGKPFGAEPCIDDLLVRNDRLSWSEQGSRPAEGRLDPTYMRRLVELLTPTIGVTEDVWFLVWAGYGSMKSVRREETELEINSSWRGSGRTYLLFHASMGPAFDDDAENVLAEPARPMLKTPNFWWPTSRRWFVSTDIDAFSTLIGGSTPLIDALLEDDVLETVPAGLDDDYDPCPGQGR